VKPGTITSTKTKSGGASLPTGERLAAADPHGGRGAAPGGARTPGTSTKPTSGARSTTRQAGTGRREPTVITGKRAIQELRSAFGTRPVTITDKAGKTRTVNLIPVPRGRFPGGIYGGGWTRLRIGGQDYIDHRQRVAIVMDMPVPTGPINVLEGPAALASLRRQGYGNPDGSVPSIENMVDGNVIGAGYGTDGGNIDPNQPVVVITQGPEVKPPPPPPPPAAPITLLEAFQLAGDLLAEGRASARDIALKIDMARAALTAARNGAMFFNGTFDATPHIQRAAQETGIDPATLQFLLDMPQSQWSAWMGLFR